MADPHAGSLEHAADAAGQLAAVLIGPLAWYADLLVSYSLVDHACSTGHHYVLHAVSAICALAALAGAVIAWKQFRRAAGANDEGGSPLDRAHFLSLLGIISNLSFLVVIVAESVPRWVLSPCET